MEVIPGRSNEGYSYIESFFHNCYFQLNQFESYINETNRVIEQQLEYQLNELKSNDQDLLENIIFNAKKHIESGEDNEIAYEIAASEFGGNNYYTESIINQEILIEFTKDNFYKSNIILLYSFIETKIIELCKSLKINNNINIDVSDLTGNNYIDKGIIYIDKLFYILKSELVNYVFISNYKKLRNKIVHNEIINVKDQKFLIDKFREFIE